MFRMFRFLIKAAVGLLVLLAVLGVGGYFIVRNVLSPDKLRPMVESKLSTAIGKPVKLGDMSIRIFPVPALRVEGIFVGEKEKAPSLGIAYLRIVPSLSAALHGSLVVDRVDLDGLDIALRRNAKGEWILPYDPPKPSAGTPAPSGSSAPPVTIRAIRITDGKFRVIDDVPPGGGPAKEVAALRDIQGLVAVSPEGVHVEKITARFSKTELKGTADVSAQKTVLNLSAPSIANADLPQIFGFIGAAPIEGLSIAGNVPFHVEMTIPQKGNPSATGELDAAKVRLNTLEITALKTPFRMQNNAVTLAPITFSAYHGKESGSVVLGLRNPMAYTVKTDLEGLDMNEALFANTSAKDTLLGTGKVNASVQGAGFDTGALETRLGGVAVVGVRNGVIKNLPLVARINQALKITSGNDKDTRFDSLDGTFAIGGGKAHTDDLTLKAGELTMAAKGDIHFNLTLDFAGTVRFSQAKTTQALHSVGEFKYLVNNQGELEVPLTITGPVSAPSVNVDLKTAASHALKQKIQQGLGDKLKSLFGK